MAKTMDYEAINGYKNLSKDDVKKIIKEKGIEMLRLEYIDMNGINRGKLMPADMIDEAFEGGIAFAAAVMAMSFDNTTAEIKGLTEYNYDDMKVVADPSTFVILPYLDKTALILGDIYYHNKPMKQSPRWFLKNMIDEYRKMGLNPVCASEVEFFLYNKMDNGGISPYTNQTNNCYTNNIRIDPKGFLQKLTKIFKEIDFKVLYMNHEYYPGQYEYNWSHAPALRNVDETSMFKGICKDVAEINDMVATFMAKPSNDTGGSGCHFHISLDDMENGENAFYEKDDPYKMSQLMKNFVAGVLKHARPLVAFLAPTINCYKRYRPDSFAPYYIGWGYDNRTTYIRIPEERGKGTRVEVRAASAATNPYLTIGGILAAGLDGIKNNLQPPEIVTTDLYHDKTKQMEAVPRSLFRALAELEKDEWLCECAGADLINNFIGLKNVEVEGFNNSVTDWEWKTYSYHI